MHRTPNKTTPAPHNNEVPGFVVLSGSACRSLRLACSLYSPGGITLNDRNISTTTAAAILLWPVGLILIGIELLGGFATGQLGLYCAGAGGVFNIRGFFCNMHQREREAYRIGQESVRSIR